MPTRHSATIANTRFYGILDTGYVGSDNWVSKYRALAQGGAGIVQIRAKNETSRQRRQLLDLVIECRSQVSGPHPILVLNDDIELCMEYPELGLHIGQDDTPPLEARERLGPNRVLGLSTHSTAQASAAMELPSGTLDYFAVGPVFATQTKPDYTPVGLELVEWVSKRTPELPFFCIGGINRENAARVTAAGATRVVTVSDVLLAPDTSSAVKDTIAALTSPRSSD